MLIIRIKSYYQNKSEISVCRAVGAKIAINVLTWRCLLVILVILIIEIEKV